VYEIRINEVTRDGMNAFAVKIGCQTYPFLTVQGMMTELGAYVSLHDTARGNAEGLIMRAKSYYGEDKQRDAELARPEVPRNGLAVPVPGPGQSGEVITEAAGPTLSGGGSVATGIGLGRR